MLSLKWNINGRSSAAPAEYKSFLLRKRREFLSSLFGGSAQLASVAIVVLKAALDGESFGSVKRIAVESAIVLASITAAGLIISLAAAKAKA